jgi:hypothetical protein
MSSAVLRLTAALALACALSGRAQAQTPAAPPAASAAGAARDLPLTAAQRASYVGAYRVALPQGGTGTVRVLEEGGVLRLHASDEGRAVRLLHQGAHVFQAEGVPGFVLTFAVDQGRATRFRVQKEDGTIDGTRIP